MPVFAVLLRGEDFVIDVDGTPSRLGFFTTRWARARTAEEAELAAVRLVKNDQTLVDRVYRDARVTPMLYADSIERRPWWQGFRTGSGYAFWDTCRVVFSTLVTGRTRLAKLDRSEQ